MGYLTYESRVKIKELQDKGLSIQQIANQIGVCRSTIYNELNRGLDNCGNYDPEYAEELFIKRQQTKGRQRLLATNSELAQYIADLILKEHYSPEQIIKILKENYISNSIELKSVNTIYAAIDSGLIPGVTRASLRSCETKMFSDGMICIPKWMREQLQLQDGDSFHLEIFDSGIITVTKMH